MKETAVATTQANKEKQGDCPFESSHISTKLCVHFSTFDQFPDRFSIGAKSGIFQLDFTHFLFSCFSFEDFCGFCYVWDFPVVCAHNAKASRVTICKRFIYKERAENASDKIPFHSVICSGSEEKKHKQETLYVTVTHL